MVNAIYELQVYLAYAIKLFRVSFRHGFSIHKIECHLENLHLTDSRWQVFSYKIFRLWYFCRLYLIGLDSLKLFCEPHCPKDPLANSPMEQETFERYCEYVV